MPKKFPRVSKMYWKKSHQCYYCDIQNSATAKKEPKRLDPDEDQADRIRAGIVANLAEPSPDMLVTVLLEHFGRACAKKNKPQTVEWYSRPLTSFAKTVDGLTVKELKKHHLESWIDAEYPLEGPNKCSPNTRHGMISAVMRAFNWALKTDRIDRNPLFGFEKPGREPRDCYLFPEQFEQLFAAVQDQPFKDFLVALRHTGCRPLEARSVEASHFRPEERSWILPPELMAGHTHKREPRRVRLNDVMLDLTKRLAEANPTGPLFRNTDGKPWNKDSLHCRFWRLQQLKKVPFPVTAYAVRHTFATDCFIRGLEVPEVAALMGHVDYKMLMNIYQHVKKRGDFLDAALVKATAGLPT